MPTDETADRSLRGRIAILAINPPTDEGDPSHVAHELRAFVRELLAAGYGVVLAHDDPALLAPLAGLIDETAALVPVAGRAGGDFALWRDALGVVGSGATELLLASTRVRGPFAPLGEVLRRYDFAVADLWGLTESWIGQYHLPSFFLGVGPRALAHPAWAAFWSALPAESARARVAQQLEIALTQRLLEAGLTAAAIWPYQLLLDRAGAALAALRAEQVALPPGQRTPPARMTAARLEHLRRVRMLQANRTPMEPLHFLWQELAALGAPFVSRELIGRNPHGIVTASDCAARVRELSEAG